MDCGPDISQKLLSLFFARLFVLGILAGRHRQIAPGRSWLAVERSKFRRQHLMEVHRRVGTRGYKIRRHGEGRPKRLFECGIQSKIILEAGRRTLGRTA
jgi:hypothetical protein